MATRSAATAITFEMVAETIAEMLSDGGDSVKVANVAKRMDSTPAVIMTILNDSDPDGNIVDGDRGELWLTGESVPAPVVRAEKSIKAQNGQTVTVPVKEGSSERQVPDAAKGERVVSEDSINNLIREVQKNMNNAAAIVAEPDSWENDVPETHMVDYDSENVTGHMILPEPEFIPAPPEGVTPNFWELAHTALTRPARMHWYKVCKNEMRAFQDALKARQAEEDTKPAPVKVERPIDPDTGMPYPF